MVEHNPELESLSTKYRARINYIGGPGKTFGAPGQIAWRDVDSADLQGVQEHLEDHPKQVLGWVDFYASTVARIRLMMPSEFYRPEDTITRVDTLFSKDHYMDRASLVAVGVHQVALSATLIEKAEATPYLREWLSYFRSQDRPYNNFPKQRSDDLGAVMNALLPSNDCPSPGDRQSQANYYQIDPSQTLELQV